MKIIKIGGSILSNEENFLKLLDYSKSRTSPVIFIFSAFGKISSEILKSIKNYNKPENSSNELFEYFNDLSNQFLKAYNKVFEEEINKSQKIFEDHLEGFRISNETPKISIDKLLAIGEILSSKFIYYLFKENNIDCKYIDVRELIKTDNNYTNAKPNRETSITKIQNKFKNNSNKIHITQGFIASDMQGNTTTMGFESSNLTAVLFADALNSKEITIFTKVNSIRTGDPEIIQNTNCVEFLRYSNATALISEKFKMLFPGMIDTAEKKSIEIVYRGFENNEQTVIASNSNFKFNFPVIHKNNDSYTITPISKENAIKLINKIDGNITHFSFDENSNCLKVEVDDLELPKFHEIVLDVVEGG